MKNLFQYITEGKNDQLSDWYDQPKHYEIAGELLPMSVTKEIRCGFGVLDPKKPLLVMVQKDDNNYTLILGNVSQITGTDINFNKTIQSGVIIKTLENCVLSIRSGGEAGNRNSCKDLDMSTVKNTLKYFKRNNSEDHFSKVLLSRYICDYRNSSIQDIADDIPSNLVEFEDCIGLPKLDFDGCKRKKMKFVTDKSTVNGKLKLKGLLDERDPEIKVVMRKSDIEKYEKDIERIEYEKLNTWVDDFNIEKLKKDLSNRFDDDDITSLNVYIESQGVITQYWETYYVKYLDIHIRLDDVKSYGTEGVVEKSASLILKDDKYVVKEPSGSSDLAKWVNNVADWAESNIKDKYGSNPSKIIITCSRLLVG